MNIIIVKLVFFLLTTKNNLLNLFNMKYFKKFTNMYL